MEKRSSSCKLNFELFLYLFLKGFTAKPLTKDDGTLDLTKWICEIPGPKDVIYTYLY